MKHFFTPLHVVYNHSKYYFNKTVALVKVPIAGECKNLQAKFCRKMQGISGMLIGFCMLALPFFSQASVITNIRLLNAPVGTTIALTGSNFNAISVNNEVFFGAVATTTSASTAASLTLTVPTGAGYGFTNKQDFMAGASPSSVAMGDFEDNGKPDLGSANQISKTVSVLRNNPLLPMGIIPTNNILYVNNNVSGGNQNGSSWANALPELADALKYANNNKSNWDTTPLQIWVAAGTYTPLYSPIDGDFGNVAGRDNAFLMVKNVQLYGGFVGNETTLANRNWRTNKTILSGDIDNSQEDNTGNAYHVIISVSDVGSAGLNGFTITEGNADDNSLVIVNGQSLSRNSAGGIYNYSSSPSLSNCTISNNTAKIGSGILNTSSSSPTLNNCVISNNTGGGIYNSYSSPTLSSCAISNNTAKIGGGIYNSHSIARFSNCIISNNTGGGVFNVYSSPNFSNCVISNNKASVGGGMYNQVSSPTLSNCVISSNTANIGGGIYSYGSESKPIITNCTFAANSQAIYAQAESPVTLNNCIIWKEADFTGNNNLEENNASFVLNNCILQSPGGYNVTGTWQNVDPLFVDEANPAGADGIFGTPDDGLKLKLGSPAVNTGNNQYYTDANGNLTVDKDLAGNPRVKDTNIDIGAYEVQSQSQSITATNIQKTYGNADFEPGATANSGLTVSYASADNVLAEAYQDAADNNKWKIKIKKAGTVTITASQPGGNGYTSAPDKTFQLLINKKPITLAFTQATITKAYDANTNATVTTGNLAFGTGEVVGTDDVSFSLSNNTASYENKNVGTNKAVSIPLDNLSLTGTAAGNYSLANTTDVSANVGEVTKITLTIKANNQTKTYDGAAYSGGNGIAFSGFALGDNEMNALSGILHYSGTAQGAINTGNYTIVPMGYTANNYNINYANGNLLVTSSADNTLSFNAQTSSGTLNKTYGDGSINASAVASSGLSATYSSSNAAVAAVNAQGEVQIKGAGTTTITANQAGDSNYQPAPAISLTVKVGKKPLEVRANNQTKTYTGIAYSGGNGLNYSGFVYGETDNVLGGTAVYRGTSQGAINTGSYTILPSGLSATNYELNYIAGTLTIQPSGNNVLTFNSQTAGANVNITYGAGNIDLSATATSGLAVSYSSSNPQVASVAGNGAVSLLAVGTATITASQPGDANHQAATPISLIITVQQKALTITANNANKTYDGQANTTGNGVSYTGFVTGENEQALQGALSYSGTAIGAKKVGSYFITPTGYTSNNYAITYQNGSLTITKAQLTITADAKTKIYGESDPTLTYITSGLEATDAVSGKLSRASGENVGNYAITQGTLSAGSNYSISYAGANLDITPKMLTITADAKSKIYGESDPTLTYTASGLEAIDAVSGNLARAVGENVGSYAITQGTLSAGNNYSISYVGANLDITPKMLTITTDAKSKIYGESDPTLTYITSGLEATDAVSGNPARASGENVGNYAIMQGTLSAGNNYSISYVGANLDITPKILTITADAKTKIYGESDPTLTYITSGLEATDAVSGNLARAAGENVGSYAITQGALSAGSNYSISYVGANLDITPKMLTITSDAKTKIYGENDPTLTYITSGLKATDAVSGKLSRASGENVGSYAIMQGTLSAGNNYSISYVGANLDITPKILTITADAKSKIYGESDPTLTYITSGLEATDAVSGKLSRASGENVGNYAITQGTLSAGNNYSISYVGANLDITPKMLTITAQNKEKFEGEDNPVLTASYSGFVKGEDKSVLAMKAALATTATMASLQGTYPITANGAAGANYNIDYVAGTLTIKAGAPASITLAANTLSENCLVGTSVGDFNSTSISPTATYTYSLVAGAGDTDNGKFSIVGNQLLTAAALNYEEKQSYAIRVKSTTQYGKSLEKTFVVNLSDVNEAPTLNAISNQTICYTTSKQEIALNGITAGPEQGQLTTVTASSSNSNLLGELSVKNGTLRYRVANGQSGSTTITIKVKDNGGIANGGVDETTQSFNLQVNALPVIAISSNKGSSLSKGETITLAASGGTSYNWSNASGIVGGQNSAMLTIRPTESATYMVTATNASGCMATSSFRIEVRDDFQVVKANNILTPNGDGKNDLWVIANIDMYPNNEVRIFDRSGRVLFTQKGYNNTWDGMLNGSPLAESTYYYIIDFGTDKLKQKGFITLIRQQ